MIFGTPPIVTNGLVMHLDAGSRQSYPGSGTTWTDLSDNRNSGSLVNNPTFNAANQGSIAFDGVNSYANLNNFSGVLSTNFTYVGWFYVGTLRNDINVVIGNRAGGSEDGFIIHYNGYLNSNRSFNVETWTAAASYGGVFSGAGAILDNSWYFTAFIANRTSGTGSLYLNTQVFTGTISSFQLNTRVWRIGNSTNGAFPFRGNIPVSMLYNRALSDAEVNQNYNALKNRFGLI